MGPWKTCSVAAMRSALRASTTCFVSVDTRGPYGAKVAEPTARVPTTFSDFHVLLITSVAYLVNSGPHVKPMPVSQFSPAALCAQRQWKPIDMTPRRSAVWITGAGESTIIVTTSTPLSARALTASASLAASTHVLTTITCVVTLGLTERAPRWKALIAVRMFGIGKPITQPSLLLVVDLPAMTPARYSQSVVSDQKVPRFGASLKPAGCSKMTSGWRLATFSAGSR